MAVFSFPSSSDVPNHRRVRVTAVLAATALLSACASGGAADPPPAAETVADVAAGDGGDHAEPSGPDEAAAPAGVHVDNCGVAVTFETPPDRIVALNSGSVEVLLALGVDASIVGALGRPESIRDDLRPAFEGLPLLDSGEDSYPSSELVLELEPELVYSVYPSAFRDTGIATREELDALDIASYLAPGRCPDRDPEEPLEVEEIWTEFRELGVLVGAEQRAEQLVTDQRAAIEAARADLPDIAELEVFWWDVGTDEPLAGACCGAPGMILRELGITNIFDDLPDHWASVGWEQVIERDPDVIVMVDFGEGDIADKQAFVADDPTLRELRAFQEDAVVVVPFSQTTPGLQNVTAIETLGAFLGELDVDG